MTDIKPWFASKTIWSSLIAVAAGVGSLFGFDLGAADQATLVEAILQILTIIASLTAIFSRVSATTVIQ